MKIIIATQVIVWSLLLSSCGKKQELTLAADTRPTVEVRVEKVETGDLKQFSRVSGKIMSAHYANISSRMMGHITNVLVKVGDKVKPGQKLASIANADIQTKIAQAEAGILEAETGLSNMDKDLSRIQILFEKESATQKELDDITTNRDVMKAKLQQAKEVKNGLNTMLSYSNVKAPFSGTITEKFVQSGDLASPGKALFSIESGKSFQAEAMVSENIIASLDKGKEVKVILKSTGSELQGKVSEVSNSSLNTGGQYLVKINLDKEDSKNVRLYSGMFINVLIPQESNKMEAIEKITIDRKAVVRNGQLTGLYTISSINTAVLRWVRLGSSIGDRVEVLSGLSMGESYITEHQGRLLNGVKVLIKN